MCLLYSTSIGRGIVFTALVFVCTSCVDSLPPPNFTVKEEDILIQEVAEDTLYLTNLFTESNRDRILTYSGEGTLNIITKGNQVNFQMDYTTSGITDASTYQRLEYQLPYDTRYRYSQRFLSPFVTSSSRRIKNLADGYESEDFGYDNIIQTHTSDNYSYFLLRGGFESGNRDNQPYAIVRLHNRSNEREVVFSANQIDSLGISRFSILAVNDEDVAFLESFENGQPLETARVFIVGNQKVKSKFLWGNTKGNSGAISDLSENYLILGDISNIKAVTFDRNSYQLASAPYMNEFFAATPSGIAFTFKYGIINAYDIVTRSRIWQTKLGGSNRPLMRSLSENLIAFGSDGKIVLYDLEKNRTMKVFSFTQMEGAQAPGLKDIYFHDGSLHIVASNSNATAVAVGRFEYRFDGSEIMIDL